MGNSTVTRTVCHARAYAWVVDGTKEDGSPNVVKVGGVEFDSTKPTKKEAAKALRAEGYKATNEFTTFEIEREDVYAQSLETFMEHGTIVERTENGRVIYRDTDTAAAE